MPRCGMCFQNRAAMYSPFPKAGVQICKGCMNSLDRSVGFLETQGMGVQLVGLKSGELIRMGEAYPTTPQTPQEAPEGASEAPTAPVAQKKP